MYSIILHKKVESSKTGCSGAPTQLFNQLTAANSGLPQASSSQVTKPNPLERLEIHHLDVGQNPGADKKTHTYGYAY